MAEGTAFVPVDGMAMVLRLVAESDSAEAGEDLTIDVDGARLARQLKHSGRERIGLLPATPGTDVLPVAQTLGQALAALTETLVLVVDAERRWAGRSEESLSGAAVFAKPLGRGLCALAPFQTPPPGAKVEAIKIVLALAEEGAGSWGHALIDLSGCTRPGELLGVLSLLQGIIVVGKSGVATEQELETAVARVPAEMNLGVLLVE